ncbi:hypothetical protein [Lacisediminihabitans sp.]|uniref:hypothetical protein n=1 Tax=Lacisediminihabitans sp. TaxID=2787631 RepID=UPI00374CD9D3
MTNTERPKGTTEEYEGRYTEADPEGPAPRSIRGAYTRTDANPHPEPPEEGRYIRGKANPRGIAPGSHHGHYTEAEHGVRSVPQ